MRPHRKKAWKNLGALLEGNEKDWPDCAIADYLSIGPCGLNSVFGNGPLECLS